MIVMHPGEFIREVYLDPLDIKASDLAKGLGKSESAVSRLLSGESDVSIDMALRLSFVLGRSPESWLLMQTDYSLDNAKKTFDTSELKKLTTNREQS